MSEKNAYLHSACFCTEAGKAARLIARKYNATLAGLDVTVNEISMLSRLAAEERISVTDLADELCFERTTLVRNLRHMEQRGLIARLATSGRAVYYATTKKGLETLKLALPIWAKVNGEVRASIGEAPSKAIFRSIRRLRNAVS